ncbi:hypothetical protein KUTeg_010561 [Tegillarca granosa]|uniref:HAT C-terminal dimerisation domain-containing protein n=1 Tax=Tegillarca granosa TaxID=220873 RepID=A0ABQ9F3A3_TEGGR|nr:hypothetical protein KUTeg_010561 [Tegillarca granosa]
MFCPMMGGALVVSENITLPVSDKNIYKLHWVTENRRQNFDDLFGDVFVTKIVPEKSVLQCVETEINNYKAESNIQLNSDPLAWWKLNEVKYPLLGRAARSYLAVQSTSVAIKTCYSF